jgi:hypothetical protein
LRAWGEAVTVKELIEQLQTAMPESKVRLAYNSGCSYDAAKSVEITREHNEPIVYISTEEP